MPESVDESFALDPEDTLAGLAAAHVEATQRADAVIATLDFDDTCEHPVMGTLSVRWVLTHCVRELAQHTGHAEILVEQLLAQRST